MEAPKGELPTLSLRLSGLHGKPRISSCLAVTRQLLPLILQQPQGAISITTTIKWGDPRVPKDCMGLSWHPESHSNRASGFPLRSKRPVMLSVPEKG